MTATPGGTDYRGKHEGGAKLDAWTDQPTLSGTRVTLRPLLASDADAVLAASSDGVLWELFYTGVPGPTTIKPWMATAERERSYGRAMPFAVLDGAGQIVGSTRFMRMSRAHRRLEIGTTFYAASAQRTGINSEAKLLLLTHAFETLDCLCVQFRTDWFNRPSRNAIERLGAKLDGVLRNHTIMADGRVRDTVCYSIVASEWPGVQQNLRFLLSRER
jgi:RimJ/RimL family protein N-acetyltransferase